MTTQEMIEWLTPLGDSATGIAIVLPKAQEAIIARLRAADELARAAYNVSNGALDPEETHYELNKAVAAYYAKKGDDR